MTLLVFQTVSKVTVCQKKNLTSVNAALVGIKLLLLTALTVAVAADLLPNLLINLVANILKFLGKKIVKWPLFLVASRLHLTEDSYKCQRFVSCAVYVIYSVSFDAMFLIQFTQP